MCGGADLADAAYTAGMTAAAKPDIDAYIAERPAEVRPLLQQLRERIHAAVPGAGETIKYGMPTFELPNGYRMYFGAWAKHVGIYPVPRGDDDFEAEVGPYRHAKDTVRFPFREPMPWELVDRIAALVAARQKS
ncbi:iron chaperone [Schumannella luteola]